MEWPKHLETSPDFEKKLAIKEVTAALARGVHYSSSVHNLDKYSASTRIFHAGFGSWRRTRLMVVGQGRKGKSAFVRSLRGQPFQDMQRFEHLFSIDTDKPFPLLSHTHRTQCNDPSMHWYYFCSTVGMDVSECCVHDAGVEISENVVQERRGSWQLVTVLQDEKGRAAGLLAKHAMEGKRRPSINLSLPDALSKLMQKYGLGKDIEDAADIELEEEEPNADKKPQEKRAKPVAVAVEKAPTLLTRASSGVSALPDAPAVASAKAETVPVEHFKVPEADVALQHGTVEVENILVLHSQTHSITDTTQRHTDTRTHTH